MTNDRGQARILVVDDDPNVHILMTDLLEDAGYSVRSCESGAQALELIRTMTFDLLITDMRMPEMSGSSLMAHVRKLAPKLPIIVMTADSSVEVIRQVHEKGAKGFIVKPFESLDHIPAKVASVLDAVQRHRSLQETLKTTARALGDLRGDKES